ncbi:hypothetical protein [Vibrio splendidus]|uniref:hypothetical protein n=1 Tax=Vibrio splendidus TaxID=29497 RepID=UPI000C8251BD|nr:hypothetical protein [Vibrio splendidus]PMH06034.1 hypothetical protein BCU75_20320 [Vibrio splendidus]
MNILEVDYGLGPLIDVEETIQAGIAKLFERNRTEPWFDGLWMNEYGEVLYGSLLVSAQAYCIGSLRDINEIRVSLGLNKLAKESAYKNQRVKVQGYSLIELVNCTANYFKHRDEWSDPWPENYTTRVLTAFSMDGEFLINELQELIESEFGYKTLSDLVSEWRNDLIAQSKGES